MSNKHKSVAKKTRPHEPIGLCQELNLPEPDARSDSFAHQANENANVQEYKRVRYKLKRQKKI